MLDDGINLRIARTCITIFVEELFSIQIHVWCSSTKICDALFPIRSFHYFIKKNEKSKISCHCVNILGTENSASIDIHEATNRQIEKICRILHMAMSKVPPHFVIWPKYFGCLGIYFTTDLGREAFELPIPLW